MNLKKWFIGIATVSVALFVGWWLAAAFMVLVFGHLAPYIDLWDLQDFSKDFFWLLVPAIPVCLGLAIFLVRKRRYLSVLASLLATVAAFISGFASNVHWSSNLLFAVFGTCLGLTLVLFFRALWRKGS